MERGGEVREHRLHIDHPIERGTLSNFLGKHLEEGEILFDFSTSGGSLNLDDDPITAFECRTVDLSDCAGRREDSGRST